VQVFTGTPAVGHTLRSPEFGAGAAGLSLAVPPTRAKLPVSVFCEEVFPMSATTWRKQAACRGLDVEAFYPISEDEADAAEAKAICAECPVRQACLEHALAHREREGVWGGTTERERRRIVRQRRKSA
jgi:WhiB family transcriptional regulator, redox-sensing transcriptional regulator